MDQVELGKILFAARTRADIHQIEAAQTIGVDVFTIGKIESGDRKLFALELIALCKLYGISMNGIVQNDSTPPKHSHDFTLYPDNEQAIRFCYTCGKSWIVRKTEAGVWSNQWMEIEEPTPKEHSELKDTQ